jgi:HSP20 family protein
MVWNAITGSAGWDPWRELHQVQSQLNRLFSDFSADRTREFPPVELWTGEDGALLRAQLPGLSPADAELSVVGDTVTLKGNRPGPEASAGERYHRQEREVRGFLRTIQLPFTVESEKVRAQSRNGVLEVTLPRAASERPRKIHVESA